MPLGDRGVPRRIRVEPFAIRFAGNTEPLNNLAFGAFQGVLREFTSIAVPRFSSSIAKASISSQQALLSPVVHPLTASH